MDSIEVSKIKKVQKTVDGLELHAESDGVKLDDVWMYFIGSKPGDDAKYATSNQVIRAACQDEWSTGYDNFPAKPKTTTKVLDVSGQGILYAAVLKSTFYCNHYIKIIIDGAVTEIRGPYRENSQDKYTAYYATQSLNGGNIPAKGLSTSATNLLTGTATTKTVAEMQAGGLDVQPNLCTNLPVKFSESLVVEMACVDLSAQASPKGTASVCYALTE